MSTLSVPLPIHLEELVARFVKQGFASTKADVVRQALTRLAEDEAVLSVLRAEQEVKDGKVLRGDLRKVLKAMP